MSVGSDRGLEHWRRRAFIAWTVIGWVILAGGVMWLLSRVWSALIPFLIALIIAFVFRWPVRRLEEKGIPRAWGVAICFLFALGLLVVAGAFILPPLGSEIAAFVGRFPGYFASAVQYWRQLVSSYRGLSLPGPILQAAEQLQTDLAEAAPAISSAFASQAVNVGRSMLTLLFDVVIALVIAFWVLKDLPVIREEILLVSGPGRRDDVRAVLSETSGVLGGYIKAQLIISTITGVVAGLGLGLIGVPYALVLGLLTAVLNVVPYLGPLIASLVAAIVAGVATQNPLLALASIAVIIVAQQVVDLFVTPRVMSDAVDLHPLLVLLSLLAGGTLFGVAGVLLGIPVAAVAKALFVHFYEKHTHVELATEDGALFKASKPDNTTADPVGPADEERAGEDG